MYKLFTFLLLATTVVCSAETFGNVEYFLPESAKNWKEANRMSQDRYSIVVYMPEDVEPTEAKESFAVLIDSKASDAQDVDAIKEGLKANFPDSDVQVNTLASDDDSLLIEWYVDDKGNRVQHAFSRIFTGKDGTATLMYLTQDEERAKAAKDTWVPALKKAKKIDLSKESVQQPE